MCLCLSVTSGEGKHYWRVVNSLIDRGIANKDAWKALDYAQFSYYYHRNRPGFRVDQILYDVTRHMAWSKNMCDYIRGDYPVKDIRNNQVFRLLKWNGYYPEKVGSLVAKWSELLTPRNTIWISGNVGSGAHTFAEALAYSVPLVGVADWRHATNPFIGCGNKLCILWKGGYVNECCVGLCTQVFGGTYTQLPLNPKKTSPVPEEIFRTPVVISSEATMTKTYSKDRGISDEYAPALEPTMYKIVFSKPKPYDIECVSGQDWNEFITWTNVAKVEFNDAHDLHEI